jgi:hypothetical protein
MLKRLTISLAAMLCAAIFLFFLTAYAEEEVEVSIVVETETVAQEATTVTSEQETDRASIIDDVSGEDADMEESVESEDSESGIPPYDGLKHLTPDGAGTVIDNVFIEGNGLEFLTFTSEDGNVFYLVIDRLRTSGNVYFLNTVTEQDLLSLAEKDEKGSGKGTSTSGIPSTPGSNSTTAEPTETTKTPEQPPAKSGGNTGMIIFLLIGAVVFGGVAYYFKIVRPKQQAADDDDGDDDDYVDDYEDDYLGDSEDANDPDGGEGNQ